MSRVWLRSVMHVKRPGRRANRPMAARRLESPHPKILSSGEKWQHSSEQAGDGGKKSQRRPSSLLCLLPKPTCTNLDQNHVSPRSCACPCALTYCLQTTASPGSDCCIASSTTRGEGKGRRKRRLRHRHTYRTGPRLLSRTRLSLQPSPATLENGLIYLSTARFPHTRLSKCRPNFKMRARP